MCATMAVPPEYILNWYKPDVICRSGHLKEVTLLMTLIYTSQHTVYFTTNLKPERRSNEDKYLRRRSKAARNQWYRQQSHTLCHYIWNIHWISIYMGDRIAVLPPNSSLITVQQLWGEHEGRSLLNYEPQMSLLQVKALAWPILILSRRIMEKASMTLQTSARRHSEPGFKNPCVHGYHGCGERQ